MDFLPSELLPCILRNLTDPRDRGRIRAVSKEWKEAADSPGSWSSVIATLKVSRADTADLEALGKALRLPGAEGLTEVSLEFARCPRSLCSHGVPRKTVDIEIPASVSRLRIEDPRDRSWDLFGCINVVWDHPAPTVVWRGSMQPLPDHPVIRAMRGGTIDATVSIWYYASMPTRPFKRLRVTEGFVVLNYTSADVEYYMGAGAERDAREVVRFLWPDGAVDLRTCPVDRIHLMLASPWIKGFGHMPTDATNKKYRAALEKIVGMHPFSLMRHEFTRDGVRLFAR